jgi:hypothetical protein
VSRFVEDAIAGAGLAPLLAARRAGDLETVRSTVTSWGAADLLVLGAMADILRAEDVGEIVRIHPAGHPERDASAADAELPWIETSPGASELDFLRAVAVARVASRKGARVGVDWSQRGIELAQVALGFGASDLRGPMQRKSGLVVLEGEKLKLKGLGMVELSAIKKQEIGLLVTHAGRLPVFVEDELRGRAAESMESKEEVAGV